MECIKRSIDCVDGGRLIKYPRLQANPISIRLESESDLSDDSSGSESHLSCQLLETASARDTSDTSSKEDSEYTLASDTEGIISEVSSGPDDVCIVGNFDQLVSEFGSDLSVVADLSDFSERSTDSEIERGDGKCIWCGEATRNHGFRFCLRCFRERKNGLPPRPKSRKTLSQESSLKDTQDSGLGLSQQSQGSDDAAEPKCGCCLEKPIDSIFLHGGIGHQIYCYKCSQRVWKERKRCPCCNRICKVVKVYRTAAFGEH